LTDGKENWAGERAFLKGLNQGMSHKFLFDSSVYSEVEYRNGEQDTSSFAIRRKRSSDRDRYRENFFDPRLIGRCPAPIGVWYNVELDRILCAPRKEKEVVETVDDFEHGSVTVVSFAPEKGYDYAKMFFSEKTGDLLKIVAWYSLPDCELVDEVVFSNHSENHNSLPLALKLTRRENEKLLFESKVKIAHASDTIPHDHRFSWKFFDLLIGTKIYDQTTERPREREWNGEEIVASSSTNPKPVVENGK
jgi:hypothetical protein